MCDGLVSSPQPLLHVNASCVPVTVSGIYDFSMTTTATCVGTYLMARHLRKFVHQAHGQKVDHQGRLTQEAGKGDLAVPQRVHRLV